MKYYLETNAIIGLTNYLQNPVLKDVAYTSLYAVLELVSGINSGNYSRKRSALNKLHQANLPTAYIFPEEKMANCFPVIRYKETRKNDFMAVSEAIIESDTFEEASEKIKVQNLIYDLNYYIQYDINWRANFIDSTVAGNKQIKALLLSDKEKGEHGASNIFDSVKSSDELNVGLTIFAYAEKYAKSYGMDAEMIFNSYNGSADVFLRALSKYCINKMDKNEHPATNDIFDLTHLLYLNSAEDIVVSDDRIYTKLFAGNSYSNVIGNSAFYDQFLDINS